MRTEPARSSVVGVGRSDRGTAEDLAKPFRGSAGEGVGRVRLVLTPNPKAGPEAPALALLDPD